MNEVTDENQDKTQVTRTPEQDPKPAPPPKSPDKKPADKGSRSFVGGLALLISILAAAGAGYLFYQQREELATLEQTDGMQAALDSQATELQRLSVVAETLREAEDRLTTDVQNLSGPLGRQLEEIPLRIQKLELALENVPGVADKARSAWLLAETEYFLRIANSQLSLAGNVDVALSAMDIADEKLRDMADPRLTPVRALLSDERAELRALPRPDSEGIVLTLGSLARSIDRFPLADGVPARFGAEGADGGDESSLQRAWRSIKQAMSAVISVKKSTEVAVAPVMSAADEIMLRRSLDMEMQIARIAVIRNQGQLYKSSIDSIRERLTRYYDPDDPAVSAAQSTLAELRDAKLSRELPDISGSLTMLMELGSGAANP